MTTLDDVANLTLAQIHEYVIAWLADEPFYVVLRDFDNWRNYCHKLAPAVIAAYELNAHTCSMGSTTQERATYHVLIVGEDDRVLDVALYLDYRFGASRSERCGT